MGAEATVAVVPGALLLEPPSKMALSILVQLTPPAVPLPPPDISHTLSLGEKTKHFPSHLCLMQQEQRVAGKNRVVCAGARLGRASACIRA